MTAVAELYINAENAEYSRDVTVLGNALLFDATVSALHVFGEAFVVVDLEEGSVRAWAKVIVVGALGTYGAIADYNGFWEGLTAITNDARQFSDELLTKITSSGKIPQRHIIRTQRRTKTPGTLLRYLARLDALERNMDQLSPQALRREVSLIRQGLSRAIADLPEPEAEFVRNAIRREHSPLVPELVLPRKAINPRYRFDDEDEFEEAFGHLRRLEEGPVPGPQERRLYHGSLHTAELRKHPGVDMSQ